MINVLPYSLAGLDNQERISFRIKDLLTIELANQKAIAQAEGLPTSPYEVPVYLEKINLVPKGDIPSIVIHFDSHEILKQSSSPNQKQVYEGNWRIVCYGKAVSGSTLTGQIFGDTLAAEKVMITAKIVRRILMVSENRVLQFEDDPPFLSNKYVSSLTSLMVQIQDKPSEPISTVEMTLSMRYLELVPNKPPITYDGANIDVETENGA